MMIERIKEVTEKYVREKQSIMALQELNQKTKKNVWRWKNGFWYEEVEAI